MSVSWSCRSATWADASEVGVGLIAAPAHPGAAARIRTPAPSMTQPTTRRRQRRRAGVPGVADGGGESPGNGFIEGCRMGCLTNNRYYSQSSHRTRASTERSGLSIVPRGFRSIVSGRRASTADLTGADHARLEWISQPRAVTEALRATQRAGLPADRNERIPAPRERCMPTGPRSRGPASMSRMIPRCCPWRELAGLRLTIPTDSVTTGPPVMAGDHLRTRRLQRRCACRRCELARSSAERGIRSANCTTGSGGT